MEYRAEQKSLRPCRILHSARPHEWENGRVDRIRTCDPLHPMQVRYQTALHPVVPVSLACPAGDFLSIHPFQQFVNPQNEFFCGFFDSFWAFFGKSPQMPVFSAFFRFPRRSSGAFSAHILLQSLLRDHAEAQKGGSSRNLGGRAAWGRVCGRAKLGAGTLRCLRLC